MPQKFVPGGTGTFTVTVSNKSTTQDISLYLFGTNYDEAQDPYKKLDEAYASADANGIGGDETISFTVTTQDTFALVIVNKNPTLNKAPFDIEISNVGNALRIRDENNLRVTEPMLIIQNPAIKTGTITFALPHESEVRVTIFDINGRKVKTLFDGVAKAGYHTYEITNLKAGVYFVTMTGENLNLNKKFIVVR